MSISYKRVVVVEDDPAILDLVITRLELEGYETFPARDGHEALALIGSVDPDAVVLDIGLPGIDGFEVLKTLKALERFHATPVLVLTARNGAGDVQRALQLGARDYVTKPFSGAYLLSRMARMTRRPGEPPVEAAPN